MIAWEVVSQFCLTVCKLFSSLALTQLLVNSHRHMSALAADHSCAAGVTTNRVHYFTHNKSNAILPDLDN